MTNIEIIGECIEADPGGICDKCIGLATAVKPHQQVVQICHKLVTRNQFARTQGECSRCGKKRFLNKPMARKSDSSKPSLLEPPDRSKPSIIQPDLDSLRRFLIQRLRALDPSQQREGFARQVIRLREKGVLPGNIANLMLAHSSFRNLAYYEAYECVPIEAQILALIDTALRIYFQA